MDKRQAVEEMIGGAMRAHDAGEYACAITLAGAAEGAMPKPEVKTLFEITRDAFTGYADRSEIIATLNAQRDWLKHDNASHPETMEIESGNSLMQLVRAVSKFHAVYGQESETPTMQSFFAAARAFDSND